LLAAVVTSRSRVSARTICRPNCRNKLFAARFIGFPLAFTAAYREISLRVRGGLSIGSPIDGRLPEMPDVYHQRQRRRPPLIGQPYQRECAKDRSARRASAKVIMHHLVAFRNLAPRRQHLT